ncbi:MAG: Gx transporter family protein [Clostridia bacterium]|nr:Gx transporter family protein [Clostridia bacterium]
MAKKRIPTAKIALCGLLTAFMLILGYFESLLPPVSSAVPGIKLGLSNSVLLFALYLLDAPTTFLLMVLKVGLSAVMFGRFDAMMFASAGGLLSTVAMIVLKKTGFSIIAVSMVGAVMHNVGQVLMAMLVTQMPYLVYYMAVLALIGLAMGFVTGIVGTATVRHMRSAGIIRKSKNAD